MILWGVSVGKSEKRYYTGEHILRPALKSHLAGDEYLTSAVLILENSQYVLVAPASLGQSDESVILLYDKTVEQYIPYSLTRWY
jgi:hypothetical protein